jgi:tetraacyldisaccharide 4'-kinase
MADNNDQLGLLNWLPIISGRDTSVRAVLFRSLFCFLSLFYRIGLAWRSWRWRRPGAVVQVPVPVISVGNLTTGGTGKTPVVQWVCRELRERGVKVALLSRGYGQLEGGVNDEALELELSLPDVPHLQDPDRVKIAQIAIEELESECLVLDDGYQHRRLSRDLDLLLVDATCPFGFGHLLPRGLLREPFSAIKRADAVILTRCDLVNRDELAKIEATIQRHCRSSDVPIAKSVHSPVALLNTRGVRSEVAELEGRRVVAFCGVGNPTAFFQTLSLAGAEVLATRIFPDHYSYAHEDLNGLRQWVSEWVDSCVANGESPPNLVMTTRKDLVKLHLAQIAGIDLLAIEIEAQFLVGEQAVRELVWRTAGTPI